MRLRVRIRPQVGLIPNVTFCPMVLNFLEYWVPKGFADHKVSLEVGYYYLYM